jgi:hypothetical protein
LDYDAGCQTESDREPGWILKFGGALAITTSPDEKKLRTLRTIFTFAEYVFMAAAILWMNLYAGEHSQRHKAYPYYEWTALLAQFLVAFGAVQVIRFTLQWEKTRRTTTVAILSGLAALLIIVVIASLQGQVTILQRDISALDRRLVIALAILQRNELLNQYQEQVGVATGNPMEVLTTISTVITAITGLIAAIAGIYIQVLPARKAQMELEIEKMKLAQQTESLPPKQRKTAPKKPKNDKRVRR